MREIEDILNFREDLSPFLVHLTKANAGQSASDCLFDILNSGEIRAGTTYGDAHYGMDTEQWHHLPTQQKRNLFSAVSFTETPLNEVHCLLEIEGRQVNLEPYGLVMLKDRLRAHGVSPVLYLNNELADKDDVMQALCELRNTNLAVARKLLPLVTFFGQKLKPPNWQVRAPGRNDWLWEREWRFAYSNGPLPFTADDVFVGLCPHDEIDAFEAASEFEFVDPHRNMKYYAKKLINARQRLGLKVSVV